MDKMCFVWSLSGSSSNCVFIQLISIVVYFVFVLFPCLCEYVMKNLSLVMVLLELGGDMIVFCLQIESSEMWNSKKILKPLEV